MKIGLASMVGAAVALLSACTTFDPKPLAPETTAAAFQGRTVAVPALRAFLETDLQHELTAWPLPSWDFDTLTLAAFYYHPDMGLARARWHMAQAGKLTSGQRPNPDLAAFPTNLASGEIQRQAVLNRADVLGALAEYAASESALQVQIAKQYSDRA